VLGSIIYTYNKDMSIVTKQEKKNLRLRALRLFRGVQNELDGKYRMELRFRDSLDLNTEVPKKNDGSFDLDFDIRFRTSNSATKVKKDFSKAITKQLRIHEELKYTKKTIVVDVDLEGTKYHYDIALFNINNNKFFQLLDMDEVEPKFQKNGTGDPYVIRNRK